MPTPWNSPPHLLQTTGNPNPHLALSPGPGVAIKHYPPIPCATRAWGSLSPTHPRMSLSRGAGAVLTLGAAEKTA